MNDTTARPLSVSEWADETTRAVSKETADDPTKHAAKGHSLAQEARSVGRHSLVYLLGPALSNAIGFVLIPIYTRYIDRSEFGIMSLVDVMMTMMTIILSLGMADGMARFYHARRTEAERRQLISTVLVAPAILGLPVVLLAMWFAGPLQSLIGLQPGYSLYLRLALLAAWFSMVAELGYAYLRLVYRSKTFVLLTTFQILAAVSMNLWLVIGKQLGIWGILYSTLLSQATVALVLASAILLQVRSLPSWREFRELLGFGIHLVPSVVSLQLTSYLSPVMIRWLLPGNPTAVLAQVGLFSTGQKIGVVANRFVTVPFQAFWRPRRMELVMQDTPEVRQILSRICTYSTLLTAQVALLLAVAAKPVLEWLVDPSYVDAHRVVPWIAFAYVILGMEHHFATGMHYARKTQMAMWIGLASLALLIMVNLALLPRWGMEMAAVATLISMSVRTLGFLWASQRHYRIPFEHRRLLLILGVPVVLFGCATQFDSDVLWIDLMARTFVGLLLLPVLAALGFLAADERVIVAKFVRNPFGFWRSGIPGESASAAACEDPSRSRN